MIPLREPKLFGEDEIMQMMISSGRFGQESPAGLKQIDHVYSAHKIPLVKEEHLECKRIGRDQILWKIVSRRSRKAAFAATLGYSDQCRTTEKVTRII
jgi:hypothetical protein